MDTNYGIASLPSGPPPPPPDSSPPSSQVGDHIGNGSSNSETNQHSSSSQQRHAKQQQPRLPLVNPVAPLNSREGHVAPHPTTSIPLSNTISGQSR